MTHTILFLLVWLFPFNLLSNQPFAAPSAIRVSAPSAHRPPAPASATQVKGRQQGVSITVDTVKHQLIVYKGTRAVNRYPVAVGTYAAPSPIGDWKVVMKQKDWGSGFGTRWIGLNVPWGIYGIHGTNRPESIGNRASHGCVRMFNQDVEQVYNVVRIGTPVHIVGDVLQGYGGYPRMLVSGDIGSDVQLVQNRLRGAGYFHGACNGKFDTATEIALKAFEKSRGLTVDGTVSWRDYHALGLVE